MSGGPPGAAQHVAPAATDAQILVHKDTRIMFDADVGREAKRYVVQQIDTSAEGPERAVIELRKMVEHALKKAGITY